MPKKEDIVVHASMTKTAIYDALKAHEYDEDVLLPRANSNKGVLLDFAIEAFGADKVIKEATDETKAWAAADGTGAKFGGGGGGATSKTARDPMDWSREEIEADAAKYENRSVWNRKGKAGHAAARAQGILEEVMPARVTRNPGGEDLSDEIVIAKMAEFDNRTDFSHAARRHYKYAQEHNLLDEHLPSKIGQRRDLEEGDDNGDDNGDVNTDNGDDGVEVEDEG